MDKPRLPPWLFYALALLLIFLLEALLLPRLSFLPLRPLLLPLSIVTLSATEEGAAGTGYGLFAGLLSFLFLPGTPSFVIFLFPLLGFLASLFSPLSRIPPFLWALLASAGVLLLLSLFQLVFFHLRYQAPLAALLPVSSLEYLITLLFFPFVYALHRILRPRPSRPFSPRKEAIS